MNVVEVAKSAKQAFIKTMNLDVKAKNSALDNIIQILKKRKDEILNENSIDLKNAETLLEQGEINKATYDRLKLDDNKIKYDLIDIKIFHLF